MATIINPTALTSTATQYILAKYYDKTYLDRLTPELRWFQAGEKKRLPQHSGKIIKFSAFRKLAIGTRLSESTKPTAKVLSTYNVTATLAQWGDFSAVSDLMEVTGITSTITEAVQVYAEQSALTIDTAIRSVAWGGHLPSATSQISAAILARYSQNISSLSAMQGLVTGFTIRLSRQCSGLAAAVVAVSAAAAVGTSALKAYTGVTLRDVRESVAILRGRDVKPKMSDGYYLGIAAPQALESLASDTSTTGWVEWQKYTTPESMMKGEVGKAEGVRFVSTTNAIDRGLATNASTSASVITILGKGALGVVDFENSLDGKGKNHIIIKRANQFNTDDPLNQIAGTVGWKSTFAAAILNNSTGIHLLLLRDNS